MSQPLLPYKAWLGISTDQQPHHYLLLGLQTFEDDQDLIQQAALRQTAKVRPYQLGEHSQWAIQLANEIGEALGCLCDPPAKQVYDNALRQSLGLSTHPAIQANQIKAPPVKAPTSKPPVIQPPSVKAPPINIQVIQPLETLPSFTPVRDPTKPYSAKPVAERALEWFQTPSGMALLGGTGLVLLLLGLMMLRGGSSGMLVVEINEPGASVTVDGEPLEVLKQANDKFVVHVEVDHQQHELKVTKDGYLDFNQQFSIQGQSQQLILVQLEPLGKPPVISGVAMLEAVAGVPWKYQLSASDPNEPAGTLSYELGPGSPPGVQVDGISGLLSWTPPTNASGSHYITVRVASSRAPSEPGFTRIVVNVALANSTPTVVPGSSGPLVGKFAGEERSDNAMQMKLCWCPPGKFIMGSPTTERDRNAAREAPLEVTLTQGFWLGKCEVTQAEYEKVMGQNPSAYQSSGSNSSKIVGQDTARFPVEFVSWDHARDYCRKLTEQEQAAGRLTRGWEYRLPTEAQWEYACRAGTITATAFGDAMSSNQANFNGTFPYQSPEKGPFLGRATTVGSYPANPWGFQDMHGNLWEWCQDWQQERPTGGIDPLGTQVATFRILRGGCWVSYGHYCRSAYRGGNKPTFRIDGVGFRVALAPSTKSTPSIPIAQTIPTTPSISNLQVGQTAGEEWNRNSLQMPFCWCPPGMFTMGSPATEKDRKTTGEKQVVVTLTQGFWLGKYEVTQAEYEKVIGKNPSGFSRLGSESSMVPGLDTSKFPVEMVSWSEAEAYAQKLTEQERAAGRLPVVWEYRLPTEAQWEYACRAGSISATAFGDQLSSEQANFKGSSPYNGAKNNLDLQRTTNVRSYAPNAWGLFDMHGNVYEWCQDWYGDNLPGDVDPQGVTSGSLRVNRGGCWSTDGKYCRSAFRHRNSPISRYNNLGFRIAIVQQSP